MGAFRGDDEVLEKEIQEIERTVRLRVRRTAQDLRDLERELRALRVERARRKVAGRVPGTAGALETDGSIA